MNRLVSAFSCVVVLGTLVLVGCGGSTGSGQGNQLPTLPDHIRLLNPSLTSVELQEGQREYAYFHNPTQPFIVTVEWDRFPSTQPYSEWVADGSIDLYGQTGQYIEDLWDHPGNWDVTLHYEEGHQGQLQFVTKATLVGDFGTLLDFGDEFYRIVFRYDAFEQRPEQSLVFWIFFS